MLVVRPIVYCNPSAYDSDFDPRDLALSLARRIRGAIAFQQLPRGVTPNLFLEAVYLAEQQR